MGFRIAGDRQAIQSGFQSDRVWANDQLCGAPPPQMQEMNSARVSRRRVSVRGPRDRDR
jgi:hypothetical protein